MTDERAQEQGVQERGDEVSILALAAVLLRFRRTIAMVTIFGLCVGLAVALTRKLEYTATTSFLPQSLTGSNSGLGGLAGLAGQIGIVLPPGGMAESPQFYTDLLRSRAILGAVAESQFDLSGAEGPEPAARQGRLAHVLWPDQPTETDPESRQDAIEWLEDAVRVSYNRQTGVVSVSVTTSWADLSMSLADRLLELVNDFNLGTRQSNAAAERVFVENRLAEVQDSLRAAEERVERFLEGNRQFAGSPELTFQHERLQRQVLMQQQLFNSLNEAFEQARIAEVRNTPVITVVNKPERPVNPDARRRLQTLMIAGMLGMVAGVVVAVIKGYSHNARDASRADFEDFHGEWAAFKRDIRTLGGLRRS